MANSKNQQPVPLPKKSNNTPKKSGTILKKPANIFDRFIRQMFERITVFIDFLIHYANPKLLEYIDLTDITPFPTHSFDRNSKERIADLIFLCGLKHQPGVIGVIIIFEYASGSVHFLPKRLLEYLVGAWNIIAGNEKKKKLLPFPYFIVVRTGKKQKTKRKPKYQQTSDMCVKVQGLGRENQLDFDYDLIYLPDFELEGLSGNPVLKTTFGVAKVLTEGHPEQFSDALLPLKNCPDYDEKRRVVNLSLELFANFLRTRNQKPNINDIDRVLNPIFNEQEKQKMITTIFEDKFLEGIAAGRVEGIAAGRVEGIAAGRVEGIAAGRVEGIAVGRVEGITVGKAEGKIEGKIEGKAESILDILKMRFKRSIPRSISNKVLSIHDPIVLASLMESAIICQSLRDFSEDL